MDNVTAGTKVSKSEIEKVLRDIFGFSSFKPDQEGIVDAVIAGRDVIAIMPTGGGKSLCYQLPAHCLDGTCVVISPLIALMKDQVDAAKELGLRAEYLNSSLTGMEQANIYNMLQAGDIDLLYVSPERFSMGDFIHTLKGIDISFIAVDEAHCISEWGHDFRPDYLSLSRIVKEFPGIPVSAFTATATEQVQDDIVAKLNLRDVYRIRASFNRPNLFYRVELKDDINRQILLYLKDKENEPAIIYRTTRQSVESTAEFLIHNGIKALPYHAGLDGEVRKRNQDNFNRDEVQVIVATIAFGMGIDKSNIRHILHGDIPKNMEGYYQETGRAGRDGEPAVCVLFFGRGDIHKVRYFINQISDESERTVAGQKLSSIVQFASGNLCRRKQVLAYFSEELKEDNCGTCDICTGGAETVDATRDGQILLSAIARTGERFGMTHIIDIVRGANTEKIRRFNHNEIKTYGAGKEKDKSYWSAVVNELIVQEALVQEGDPYPSLCLTDTGKDIMTGKQSLNILKQAEKKSKSTNDIVDYNADLFEILRKERKEIADRKDVPPFVVFSDKTLHDMCRFYPATADEMMLVHGIGQRKMKQYGEQFIALIKEFISENPVTRDLPMRKAKVPGKKTNGISATRDETLTLIKQGLSYTEIAEARSLTESTIAGHIEWLIHDGHDVFLDNHVEPEKQKSLEKLFINQKTGRLKEIIEASNGMYSFEEARMVRALLEQNGTV